MAKESYHYGFGFFGTVSLIKVPHANAPLDLHIRIGRDFQVEKPKEKSEKKTDDQAEGKVKGRTEGETETVPKTKAEEPKEGQEKTKEGEGKPKKASDESAISDKTKKSPRSKKMWNMVVFCDEWKDIYGVKNVTVRRTSVRPRTS